MVSAYTTMSDSSGGFVFNSIPPTTYVLHIEGGGRTARISPPGPESPASSSSSSVRRSG